MISVKLLWFFFIGFGVAFTNPLLAQKSEEFPEVFVERVKEAELFDPVTFGGFVEAADKRSVGPEITGTVNQVLVKLGQKVKRGEVLFNLRPQGAGLDYRINQVPSPIGGIVAQIIHDPGTFIQAGEGVVVVADERDIQVEIQVTYDDLPMMKLGESADVVLNGQGHQMVSEKGKIISVSPSAHPELGTFPVELSINCATEPCSDKFRIGTFVRVVFKSNFHKGIKVDPKYLVHQRQKAMLLTKKKEVKFVEVKLGNYLGAEVEVLLSLIHI